MVTPVNVNVKETESSAKRACIFVFHAFLGSLFLGGLSQIEIPMQPVPLTLQTLAVFLLALFQGGNKAALSVLFYLGEATMGFPVLHGGISNPLWIAGPTAGYLLSFPLAAFVIGKVAERKRNPSLLWIAFSVALGQCVIYFLGLGWLSFLIGFPRAFAVGFLPFLPTAVLKIGIAACLKRGVDLI